MLFRSKALLHSAEVADATRDSAKYGVKSTFEGIDIAAVTTYRKEIVASKYKGLQGLIIDTVERVEIIRDLRLGKFDVLVGINLLREGLDMPEVSLVAILDADKEGFLRSTGSLIQTIGRAARNLRGKAILYADRMTNSMQRAIDETDRRRARQVEYNLEHGITPQSIARTMVDIFEGARYEPGEKKGRGKGKRVAEAGEDYALLTPSQRNTRLRELEQSMYQHARDLEFEDAAKVRDQIRRLKDASLAG